MKTKRSHIHLLYLLFYHIFIMTSCINNRSPQYLLDLRNSNSNSNLKSVPLSTIGNSVKYIPLETNSVSILKTILHIDLCDSIIFLCDNDKLLKFGKAGRFIKQIGRKGRGPGEYPSIYDFCIDKTNRLIYISASSIKEILIFDFDGNFIKSFKVPYISVQLVVCDTNTILFRNPFPDPNVNYNWYITDSYGKILSKFWSFPGRDGRSKLLSQSSSPMYLFDGKLHFKEYGIDTLYFINNSTKEPYAIFNMGNLRIDPYPVDFDMEKVSDKIWVYKIFEDRNNFYLNVSKGWTNTFYHCIYNKKKSETITLKENGFINDIDGGMNFWPQYVNSDTTLISYIEAYEFLAFLNNKLANGTDSTENDKLVHWRTLKSQLTETSNPIVMIVH
jgi:hypothetical protein